MDLQIGDYKIEKILAKNKFGKTYKATHPNTQKKVVIKELYHVPKDELLQILKTINNLNSPSFLKSTYLKLNNKHYIIRDYAEGTDLKTAIKGSFKYAQIPKRFIIQLFINLLKELQVLHSNNILHTDIKPSNIFIKHHPKENPSKWNPENIVLLDYERAITFPAHAGEQYKSFSLIYSPPEQVLKKRDLFSQSTDTFATAISLLEALTKQKPLYDCNAEILINLQLTYPIPKPRNIDTELFNIISPAIYKERFPRPPRLLHTDEIIKILTTGVEIRERHSKDLIKNLEKWLDDHPQREPHWINKLFYRIFIEKQ
ncbi:protein kinase domain-containing protein [Plebeiibacterium marinum]|uniref:non-specific serine/threonine protein kinase n=1 Tax=Plebeiibacterium marinum TaxID=2992111 RepID=A0AAE3ME72_9BACT|nr:protein kinase [Plebeiobacterium marinum]MCW3805965.1 protein kinase [Plebeiobacterium marinum]